MNNNMNNNMNNAEMCEVEKTMYDEAMRLWEKTNLLELQTRRLKEMILFGKESAEKEFNTCEVAPMGNIKERGIVELLSTIKECADSALADVEITINIL